MIPERTAKSGQELLRRRLVNMGVEHFWTLFHDEGWQDAIENWVTDLPDCPILFSEDVKPEEEQQREDEFFAFMEERETDLIGDIVGAITKRAIEETRRENTEYRIKQRKTR